MDVNSVNGPYIAGVNPGDLRSYMQDKSGTRKVPYIPNSCYVGAWLGISPDYKEPEYTRIFRERRDAFPAKLGNAAPFLGTNPSLDIVMMFQQWSNGLQYSPFPKAFCKEASSKGQIPMITWEPSGLPFDMQDPSKTYLDRFNDEIENCRGEIYEYAKKWADAAKDYGKPFFLRPFHEMNIKTQYPWTGYMNGGPEKVKRAWINLYKLFKSEEANNATFVWCPNASVSSEFERSVGDEPGKFFPGNEYVDWVGVDGYRRRGGTFESIFGYSLRFLFNPDKDPNGPIDKHIIICETSSTPDAGKAKYIRELFEAAGNGVLSGIMWFNENKKFTGKYEANWLIDAESLDAKASPEIIVSKRAKDLMCVIDKRRFWLKLYPQDTDIRIKLASYEEQMAGHATGKTETARGNFRKKQYETAIEELKKVPPSDRNYLKACDQMKNLYLELKAEQTENVRQEQDDDKGDVQEQDNDKSDIQEEARKICQDMIDKTEINSQYISRWATFKGILQIFKVFDPTGFAPKERPGYRASTYLTIAKMFSSNDQSFEAALRNFQLAVELVDPKKHPEFSRPNWAVNLDDLCVSILDRKMPAGWWAPAERSFAGLIEPFVKDGQRDLKNAITLGKARLICIVDGLDSLKKGIQLLEDFAYSTPGVNEDNKNEAKYYLMKAITRMKAIVGQDVKNNAQYYALKFRELYALKSELATTAYGGRAAAIINKLSANLDEELK
jgi:tetratricopeptide (TPR) repeat protein